MAGRHVGAAIGGVLRQRFLSLPAERRLRAIKVRLVLLGLLYAFLAINVAMYFANKWWLGVLTMIIAWFSIVFVLALPFMLWTARKDWASAKQ